QLRRHHQGMALAKLKSLAKGHDGYRMPPGPGLARFFSPLAQFLLTRFWRRCTPPRRAVLNKGLRISRAYAGRAKPASIAKRPSFRGASQSRVYPRSAKSSAQVG